MNKQKAKLNRARKELSEWTKSPSKQKRLLEDPVTSIASYAGGDPGVVTANLLWPFTWHTNTGATRVLNNEVSGWIDLGLAQQFAYWRIRLVREWRTLRPMSKAPTLSLNDSALAMGLTVTLGRMDDAKFIGDSLLYGLENDLFDAISGTRLAPLMLGVFSSFLDKPPLAGVSGLDDVGLYRPLLEHWQSESSVFLPAVITACDFHVARSADSNARELFEFERLAFRIFPVEILATLRLRALRGHDMPAIEHPLLDPLLLAPPPTMPQEGLSPDIMASIEKARRELSEEGLKS